MRAQPPKQPDHVFIRSDQRPGFSATPPEPPPRNPTRALLDKRESGFIGLRREQVERPDRHAHVIADQEDIIWLIGTSFGIPSQRIEVDPIGWTGTGVAVVHGSALGF